MPSLRLHMSCQGSLPWQAACIDLHHLTRLTSLYVKTSMPLSGDSVLPKELITLTAHCPCNLHPGSKLQSLRVTPPHTQQSLGLMQHLPKLPQLQDLSVEMSAFPGEADNAEVFAVVAAVQHATQVTAPHWNFEGPALCSQSYAFGSVLAGLTQLRRLRVWLPGMPEAASGRGREGDRPNVTDPAVPL